MEFDVDIRGREFDCLWSHAWQVILPNWRINPSLICYLWCLPFHHPPPFYSLLSSMLSVLTIFPFLLYSIFLPISQLPLFCPSLIHMKNLYFLLLIFYLTFVLPSYLSLCPTFLFPLQGMQGNYDWMMSMHALLILKSAALQIQRCSESLFWVGGRDGGRFYSAVCSCQCRHYYFPSPNYYYPKGIKITLS